MRARAAGDIPVAPPPAVLPPPDPARPPDPAVVPPPTPPPGLEDEAYGLDDRAGVAAAAWEGRGLRVIHSPGFGAACRQ